MLPPAGREAMILVFGSINVDIMVPVPHLPAPGETVLGGDYIIAPGGKGANQALAARRAGSNVLMVGAVGRDVFAETALLLLRRDGVDLSLVTAVDRPTGYAAITVDAAGENTIAGASGANLAVNAEQVADRLLGPEIVLLVQREIPAAENATLMRRARERGTCIVMSLAPAGPITPIQLEDIDILIANEGEAATLGSDSPGTARRLRQGLIVTRGAAGAVAFLANGDTVEVPTLDIKPVDTTGAGDTFAGVLAAGLDQKLGLDHALRRASAAAALACLAIGAQPAMPDCTAIDAAADRLQA
jgi:ribokinase